MIQIITLTNGISIGGNNYPHNTLTCAIINTIQIQINLVASNTKIFVEDYTNFIGEDNNSYITPQAVIDVLLLNNVAGGGGAGDVTQAQLNAEISARQTADTTLQSNIDTVSTALDNEITVRGNADDILEDEIVNEAVSRLAADNILQDNINDEEIARESADSTLQTNIDNEAIARADADSTLQSNINTEATSRASADSTLQSNITTLGSRTTILENNELKVLYFASVSAATGQITIPTGATVLLDQFYSGGDAVAETIANSQPTGQSPITSGGAIITISSFDTAGNYILSGTPSAYPVAIVYLLKIKEINYSNLTIANILSSEDAIKLDNTLTSAYVFVGNSNNVATGVSISGDITISNSGVVSIGANKVTNAMLAGSIANNKLANSTISGIALGSNLGTLTFGTGLSGTSYNGSTGVTIAVDTSTIATKAYADSLVVGLLDDRGNFDASGNVFPSSGGSGSAGAILKGDLWTISVAGTLGGHITTAGDVVRALSDSPGQTDSNWAISENNFGYVALNQALADGKIYIGNGSGIGTAVTLSGDITTTNAGVTSIGASKVTNSMLAGSITYSKLSLTGAILNADLAGSIAYSKLSLTGAILNADLAGSIDLAAKVTGILPPANGGTGVANNSASTLTISGNFATTLTVSATSNATIPAGTNTLYSTKLASISSAQMLASMSDPTGTGLSVFATTPTFTTNITTPKIIGGTAAGSKIDYVSTSGTGTTTLVAHEFWGGTNGATNLGGFYNDGQILFGTTTRNPGSLGIVRIGQGTSTIDIGEQSSGVAGIWLSMATPSSSNYSMRGTSTITYVNSATSTGDVQLSYAGTTRYTFSGRSISLSPNTFSSGVTAGFTFTGAASTAQTAATESSTVNWDLSAILQHASNTTVVLQRDFRIQARTHSFATSSGGIITDLATAAWSAPISGTNAAPVNVHALLIETVNTDGAGAAPTNSYGITCNAMTGAGTNYSAQFVGGDLVLNDGVDIITGTSTGSTIFLTTSQKGSFWGKTPIIQPASVNQAAMTNNTTGSYDGTLADVGIVFSQSAINNNFTDLYTVVNEMRNVLVNTGIMKGAA